MSFQTQVNIQPAIAIAGDFASANPRASTLASEAGFIAGPGGVTVGKFAWIQSDDRTVQSYGSAPQAPHGFVHREMQALIGTYLDETSNVIPAGFGMTLHSAGDFYATVEGSTAATRGAAIYAAFADGSITIGSAATGGVVTASIGSTSTGTANVGDATQIDITSVTGLISVGEEISGTGITAGTTIVSQVSGTAGGAGVYTFTPVATAYAASTTVTATGGVLTSFKAQSNAAVGELVKISTWG